MSVKNKGPLPGGGSDDHPPVSRQRRTVLQHLRGEAGTVTVTAFAEVCGLHPNTVREHLDALVEAGLAERTRAPVSGRGRPAWRYRARPPEASAAREYAGLAAVLARQIARSSADPQADALAAGEEWGRALLAGQEPAASPREARGRVMDLLGDIGFAPETDEDALGARLPRCPFIEVAREHPGVICTVHAGLVRAGLAALGGEPERVALHPFAEPGACLLRLDAAPEPAGTATGTAADPESPDGTEESR
ncbi:helix-turn-helix domain-containing protein [Streptomyces sp. ACA25]|uniref:helix-turn-helix transcriptional regulator n=1 Tax=Streptomyces sp. ACA25 TaxID=3022596 RepID=UPI0023072696|nr:helix-turn-helix domain-containing protein [Streptomyces sp. ACA25]MDB1086774.1 helix-turn-helix domain-containing protein [Streptomyces sp. ACA25]